MSKFDDIFRDRLEEESSFANEAKNWASLSKRIDAYQIGVKGWKHYVTAWKATAIGAALIASALGWKMSNMAAEKQALEARLHAWEAASETAPKENARLDIQTEKSVATPTTPYANSAGHVFENNAQIIDYQKFIQKNINESGKFSDGKTTATPEKMAESSPSIDPAKWLALQKALTTKSAIIDSLSQVITHLQNQVPEAQQKQDVETKNIANEDAAIAEDLALKAQIDHFLQEALAQQMPVAAPVPPAVIEPFKPRKSRILIGLQALGIGFGDKQLRDAASAHAFGLQAEYRLLGNLWLQGGIEKTSNEVDAIAHPEAFGIPEPPKSSPPQGHHGPHPKPGDKFMGLQSDLQFVQIPLGLRYRIPTRFALQAVLSASHIWVRNANNTVVYEFDEPQMPGGPKPKPHQEFFVEKTQRSLSANNWRLGIGLDYPIKTFVLNASINYQIGNKSNNLMPNAWVGQIGASVKF